MSENFEMVKAAAFYEMMEKSAKERVVTYGGKSGEERSRGRGALIGTSYGAGIGGGLGALAGGGVGLWAKKMSKHPAFSLGMMQSGADDEVIQLFQKKLKHLPLKTAMGLGLIGAVGGGALGAGVGALVNPKTKQVKYK